MSIIYKSSYPTVEIADGPFGQRILDALWQNSIADPKKKALVNAENYDDAVTYRDLYLQSLSVAAYLDSRHFRHGDVICAVLPNCWQYAPIFIGGCLLGGAFSGASAAFTEYELQRQFLDSGASVVVCSEETLTKTLLAARKCPRVGCVIIVEFGPRSIDLPFGVVSFSDVINTPPPKSHPQKDVDINRDILLLPYSSGTTGSPKGVMINHKNLGTMQNIISYFREDIVGPAIRGDDTEPPNEMLMLPFYHCYGFGIFLNLLLLGGTGVIMTHFHVDIFCKTIEVFKLRSVMVVPPILVVLAKHPAVSKYNLSSLKLINSGAAPAGKDLCDEVRQRLPSVTYIAQGYGMTEVTMAAHLSDPAKYKMGAAGKLAPLTEMRIVDVATGKDLPPNQPGEVFVRSPCVMMGYLNRPQATAETIDDDGWLHTGDIGYVTDDEWLVIVDRLKELIKVKGLQVPPAELEDILLTHPGIQDVAVIGVPDSSAGELPRAYIVKAKPQLTADEVHAFINEKVAPYKQLKGGIEFVSAIPKSPAGKILRRIISDKYLSKSKI